mgnify:CR=1 FL=1
MATSGRTAAICALALAANESSNKAPTQRQRSFCWPLWARLKKEKNERLEGMADANRAVSAIREDRAIRAVKAFKAFQAIWKPSTSDLL